MADGHANYTVITKVGRRLSKSNVVLDDVDLLGQWLNFKLFGITYSVRKIKFKLLFQGPLAK